MTDWQPIESAPRDGSYILARVSPKCERWPGRCFVICHAGLFRGGYDLGWNLFPGCGGFPDQDFEGWQPLPQEQ